MTLIGLKVKVSGFIVKFVGICEWFDGFDRLKIIFKSRKNKITKVSFMLNMIKNYLYISLICCRQNINMYQGWLEREGDDEFKRIGVWSLCCAL